MNAELWAAIKRMFNVDKFPIAEIARRLHIDRKTVRRALRSERLPAPRQAAPRPSKLDRFKPYIQERLAAYPLLPGTVLLREIQRQGYNGKIRILSEYLHAQRGKAKEVFLRIETPPGEEIQADWMHCGTVRIGRALRKLSAFVATLSFSRLLFVRFTLSQRMEDFLQSHLEAFAYFGGVARKIRYDNLRLVVLSRFGTEIRFNPRFLEFAGVFGFEPVLCNPARGNEKGKVENNVRLVRTSFLAGREPRWPEIQQEALRWLDETANVRLHRTTNERPIDRWEQEKPFLMPPPTRPYDPSVPLSARSTHQALVRFDGNLYSVPFTSAHKTLTVRASFTTVRLFDDALQVAAHPRSFDRGQVIEDPKHFEGLIKARKKGFLRHIERRFLELGPDAKTYLEGLVASQLRLHRHLTHIVELAASYGKDAVHEALTLALTYRAFGAAYIHNILLQKRTAQGLDEIRPLHLPQRPEWNDLVTEEPDLSLYDKLTDFEEPLP